MFEWHLTGGHRLSQRFSSSDSALSGDTPPNPSPAVSDSVACMVQVTYIFEKLPFGLVCSGN